MTKQTIKTGVGLQAFFERVIQESLRSAMYQRSLEEKEKQDATAGAQGGTENSGGAEGGDTTGSTETAPTPSKTMDDETEKLKQGDITADDVVEKLNAIRAGKSFKDEAVSGAMSEYVESLSKAERTALLAFLKGIAQITTGEVPGKQAVDPDSNPANVDMEKQSGVQKKSVKPNVIKDPSGGGDKAKGAEDTSGPVPITPKKK